MSIDKSSPEGKKFIITTMDYLEQAKSAIGASLNETNGYKMMETQAGKLLSNAENMDRAGSYTKAIVKLYFTAALLFQSLKVFSSYDNSHDDKVKFAKWRSTHIHQCLMQGNLPDPLPKEEGEDDLEAELDALEVSAQPSQSLSRIEVLQNDHTKEQFSTPINQPVQIANQSNTTLNEVEFARAKKLAKFAISAMDYEDVPGAIVQLEKCLQLLKTGKE